MSEPNMQMLGIEVLCVDAVHLRREIVLLTIKVTAQMSTATMTTSTQAYHTYRHGSPYVSITLPYVDIQ